MKKRVSIEMAPSLPHGEDTRSLNIPRKNLRRNPVNGRDIGIDQEVDPKRDLLGKSRSNEIVHPVKKTKWM